MTGVSPMEKSGLSVVADGAPKSKNEAADCAPSTAAAGAGSNKELAEVKAAELQ